MCTTRARMQGRQEIIVGGSSGQHVPKKQWVVLLNFATLEVGTNICSDSLARSRHAAHTAYTLLMKARHTTRK